MFKWLVLMLGMAALPAAAAPDAAQIAAFHAVVQTGSATDMQAMILANPALVSAADGYGFQAVHMLDYIEFDQKLVVLLAAGADINAQNDEGMTLLHFIAEPAFIPLLVAAGADVNARDSKGRVPLMVNLLNPDKEEHVMALLRAGADSTLRDHSGASVRDYARDHSAVMLAIIESAQN